MKTWCICTFLGVQIMYDFSKGISEHSGFILPLIPKTLGISWSVPVRSLFLRMSHNKNEGQPEAWENTFDLIA